MRCPSPSTIIRRVFARRSDMFAERIRSKRGQRRLFSRKNPIVVDHSAGSLRYVYKHGNLPDECPNLTHPLGRCESRESLSEQHRSGIAYGRRLEDG